MLKKQKCSGTLKILRKPCSAVEQECARMRQNTPECVRMRENAQECVRTRKNVDEQECSAMLRMLKNPEEANMAMLLRKNRQCLDNMSNDAAAQ